MASSRQRRDAREWMLANSEDFERAFWECPKMSKQRNREDVENRTWMYDDWRRQLGLGEAYDIDTVEWRNGEPVAVFELTRCDPIEGRASHVLPPGTYFRDIIRRFDSEHQGQRTRQTAQRLGVPVWIVVFNPELSWFAVYNYSDGGSWWHLDRQRYIRFLEWLEHYEPEEVVRHA